jgi:RNA polymerase sigma-70 factor (ECF subfamily)
MKRPAPAVDAPDLVEACRRGDRAALAQVFTTHSPYLERLLGRLAGPEGDVEDLLQTTFVAAIRAFPGFRGEAAVRTWLARIAVRTAQERSRKPERRRRVFLELVGDRIVDENGPDPERSSATRQHAGRVEHHLQAIAPKKRAAFVLHVLEGHPIEEVAAMVGASRAATKSRVFWARRELMQRMRKDPGLCELFTEEPAP